MASGLICEECGKLCVHTYRISKQIGGVFYLQHVCDDCKQKHDNYLEGLRQNFRAQFGEK